MLALDNGAYGIKVNHSYNDENSGAECTQRIYPNCVTKSKSVKTRVFVSKQIEECKDFSSLFYSLPFQKGYMANFSLQKQIWDHIFGRSELNIDLSGVDILLTEPPFNFSSIREWILELFFEEYQVQRLLLVNSSDLSNFRFSQLNGKPCSLIIDSGYSFTHFVPYCGGKKFTHAIRRLDVGGKLLTNHLKELISYRQLMMMDETYVVNQMKEDSCYVTDNFNIDMKIARLKPTSVKNTIARDYVLPDYSSVKRGFLRLPTRPVDNEQIIHLANERFSVPEVLFNPSDIGIRQQGLCEAVVTTVNATHEYMRPHLYSNILLTGGNFLFPGIKERFERELRSLVPDEFVIDVTLPKDPIRYSIEAAVDFASGFSGNFISREQYNELGADEVVEKFEGFLNTT